MRSSEFFAEAARMTVDAVKALAECFARAFLRAGVPPSGEGNTQAGEAARPEVAAPLSPRASAIAPQQPVPEKHRKVPMMIDDATRNSVADQL